MKSLTVYQNFMDTFGSFWIVMPLTFGKYYIFYLPWGFSINIFISRTDTFKDHRFLDMCAKKLPVKSFIKVQNSYLMKSIFKIFSEYINYSHN